MSTEQIKVGGIVLYQKAWFRVRSMTKTTANLTSTFGSKILHKQVPLADLTEDYQNWHANWTKSETYASM